ncbi:exodeoxyribonuclease VII small subunit [bacterium E08(2017)]|nr:exodeoxyribonuclease VII small subunit [bacterium E08(2017)]
MTAEKEESFEKSIVRLEKIVEDMESGDLDLDKMIAKFEEGQALIKLCNKKLNEVEKKVEVLVKKGESITTEEIDSDD